MPAPDPYIHNKCVGRSGTATMNVNWLAQSNDDLSSTLFLDPTADLNGYWSQESFAIKKVYWRKATSAEVVLEFDALGDGREILTLPEGETEGEESFLGLPDGARTDPDLAAPSNIVVSTDGALSTDRLYIRVDYKVKGLPKANGVLS